MNNLLLEDVKFIRLARECYLKPDDQMTMDWVSKCRTDAGHEYAGDYQWTEAGQLEFIVYDERGEGYWTKEMPKRRA